MFKLFRNWFHRPLTMRVRYDHCIAAKPELTVVFLHGIASSYATWREVLPPLTRDKDLSKVRFVALDLIGFGKSEKPENFDYSYESYRHTLTRTLKKLKIHTPLILCGHSMGCLIAIDYASNGDHLVDQLILISPPEIRANEIAGYKDQLYTRLYGGLRSHTDAKVVGQIAGFVDALTSFEKKALNTPAFQKAMDNVILNSENYEAAVSLKIPMEVIHGRFDPLVITSNLRHIAKRNKYFHLTETFGGHDMTGAKAKKIDKITKETLLHFLLHIDF